MGIVRSLDRRECAAVLASADGKTPPAALRAH